MIPRAQFAAFAGVGSGDQFPDPFVDVSSLAIPQNLRSALYWCEFIYNTFGTYRMATERVISYFLTDVEIIDASEDEEEKWASFLRYTLKVMSVLQDMLRDRACYGNAFASVIVPFQRFLTCRGTQCGSQFLLREVVENPAFQFQWQIPEFIATCPSCRYRGPWAIDDKPDQKERSIRVKRWSPHEIDILYDPYTDETHYLWRIPEDYKRQVRQGHLFHLERVPQSVLEAIAKDQFYRFHPDAIYHMREPSLAGVPHRGWGIPRLISNFRQIYYVQVLRRFNEAIALDYVVPFRLITPAMRPTAPVGGGLTADPLMTFDGGNFLTQVQAMIRRRRRDPAAWQVLPFPVNYQLLGGEATQLAPRDLLDQGMEQLLNDVGTPVDLYRGTLQLQAAPVALRLFEATFQHLVHDANDFLRWLVGQISQILSWEHVTVRLKRVTIADDVHKQVHALQLMMNQVLSGKSGLAALGFDWDAEQRRLAEESRIQAELQARVQKEMDQAGFAQQVAQGQLPGAAPPPGAAAPPPGAAAPPPGGAAAAVPPGAAGPVTSYIASVGSNVPQSPEDMLLAAQNIARELLGLPEGIKDSELRRLKQYNPVLHSVVRQAMDDIRRTVRMQAGSQVLASGQF